MLDQAVQIADDAPESSNLPAIHAPDAPLLAQDSQIADNSSGVPLPVALNVLGAPILAQDAQRDINVPNAPQPLPVQQLVSNEISQVLQHHIRIVNDEDNEAAQWEHASNIPDIPGNSSGRKRKRGISGSQKRRKAELSSQEQAFATADGASGTARTSLRNEQDTELDEHTGGQIQNSMKLNGGSIPLKSAKRKRRKAVDKIPKIINLPVLVSQDENEVPHSTEEGGESVAQRLFLTTNSEDEKLEVELWHNSVIVAMLDAPFSSEIINQCAVYDKLSPEKKKTHRCREEKPGNIIHQLRHLLERHYDLGCPFCIENFQILRNPQDAYSGFKSVFYDTISELRAHIRSAHILPWYCTTCNKRLGINTKSKGKQHSCTNPGFVLRLVPELEDLNTCIRRSKNSKDLRKNMYRDNKMIYEYNRNPMEDRSALDELSSYRVPLAHSSDDSGQQQQSRFPEFVMDYEWPSEQELPAANVQFEQPTRGPCHDNWQQNVFSSAYQESDFISPLLENSQNSSVPLLDYSSITNDSPPVNHSNHSLNLDSQLPAHHETAHFLWKSAVKYCVSTKYIQ
ncbi:hypothetical protein BZA77DRAFT_390459 [Pyronema omphalodes]|nr:hypothetical protein BZA77DRAFT_390459 [Pyronema omphalodes]